MQIFCYNATDPTVILVIYFNCNRFSNFKLHYLEQNYNDNILTVLTATAWVKISSSIKNGILISFRYDTKILEKLFTIFFVNICKILRLSFYQMPPYKYTITCFVSCIRNCIYNKFYFQ